MVDLVPDFIAAILLAARSHARGMIPYILADLLRRLKAWPSSNTSLVDQKRWNKRRDYAPSSAFSRSLIEPDFRSPLQALDQQVDLHITYEGDNRLVRRHFSGSPVFLGFGCLLTLGFVVAQIRGRMECRFNGELRSSSLCCCAFNTRDSDALVEKSPRTQALMIRAQPARIKL